MAAGVGKTYAMLEEGQERRREGEDVVIGWLEPHGRAETSAMASGLEVVAPLERAHRGVPLRDMDTAAVIARAPALALVDELAHTNAPGMEHAKRFEDVAALLAAGIDVISTVNVQHLESLNDRVYELTGVRVRETIPDQVLLDADEVELVDLTPEALQAARTRRCAPSSGRAITITRSASGVPEGSAPGSPGRGPVRWLCSSTAPATSRRATSRRVPRFAPVKKLRSAASTRSGG